MVRVWPITGSSRGVGRVLAEKVLELGDIVIATTRNPSQFDDLMDVISTLHSIFIPLDKCLG
ncbi:hypothetical protein BFJ63_vAg18179 [Fusarium oxysporum f. sp. narcissi]|uniref:Uncharacterized protein n=1 Tax=Fusarium oxysporum f. sp. narcissi TaxID=451672 RepID=A0A4V1RXQ7_FUSOX|nr:hypothetical protein BFJ63_vAg18179 [Fusarium oxysporum f. sp. narcissi]